MGHAGTGEGNEAAPGKDELLRRIRRSRAALEETLNGLTEAQLERPGPEDWSIKDHLAHMATWELGIAELLRRRPRFEAMGVAQAVVEGRSEDEVNDLIYRQHKEKSVETVLAEFNSAHSQMMQQLEALDEAELFKPYAAYAPGDTRQEPVFGWIVGNTFAHFDEHHGYIRSLLAGEVV